MIIELNKTFRKIKYSDSSHKYFINGKPSISVTQLLSKLSPYFDSDYWSNYKSLQQSGYKVRPVFNSNGLNPRSIYIDNIRYSIEDVSFLDRSVTQEDILLQWDIKRSIGNIRGSFTHKYLETLEQGLLDVPRIIIPHNLSTDEAVQYIQSIEQLKKMCVEYVETNQHLIPIAIEYKVGDLQSGLTGTFDRLYWNELTNKAEIWDFKTDKEVKKENKYKQKFNGFNDIEYNDLNKYFLQISFYKYIIENNTSLKVDVGKIVHFNLSTQQIDYFDCVDYSNNINNEQHWKAYL